MQYQWSNCCWYNHACSVFQLSKSTKPLNQLRQRLVKQNICDQFSWWRHQLEKFSALLALHAGNSSVTGEFPAQRPVTWSFDVFFHLRLNKRLSKQWSGWWFETPSLPLWRQCNVVPVVSYSETTWAVGIAQSTHHENPGYRTQVWDIIHPDIGVCLWCELRVYISYVVATSNHVSGFLNFSDAITRDVRIIISVKIWSCVLHVEHISFVITNCIATSVT